MKFLQGFLLIFLVVISNVQGQTYTEWTAFGDCTETCNINSPYRTRTRTCTPAIQCQNAILTNTVACNREYPCPEFEEHFYTGEVLKYNVLAALREIKETFLISFKAVLTNKIEESITGGFFKSYGELDFFQFGLYSSNFIDSEFRTVTGYSYNLHKAIIFVYKKNEVNASNKWSNITLSQLKTNSTYFLQLKVNDEIVWKNEALEPQISTNTTVYFDLHYVGPDSSNYIKDIYIATGEMRTISEWSSWGACSDVCNNLVTPPSQSRSRSCIGFSTFDPNYSGCPSISRTEQQGCNLLVGCSGTYTAWGAWHGCSETCQSNANLSPLQTKYRQCIGATLDGSCSGQHFQTQACNIGVVCPEADTFSEWSNWLACSSNSSGPGITYRFRTCLPGYGSCIGDFSETRYCIFSLDKCSNINFIFVFVLDSSSIVDDQGWADEKKLVSSFLKSSLFGVNLNVDVAVVNFGNTSRIEADCGVYKNLSSFTIFMNNLPRINGGTAIHKGLTNAEIALQRCLKLNSYPVIILFTGGFENVDTDIDENIIIENSLRQKAIVVAGATNKYGIYEIYRITDYFSFQWTFLEISKSYNIYADNFTYLYSSFANRLYPFVLEISECKDKCSNINFIFVFVLDSSSIVDDQGWADEKKLVLSFLKSSLFGVNLNVDVAVVNFGTTSRIEADCGIYKNLSSFTIFMNNLPRINGGTAIHKGLTNAEIALQRCLKLNSYPVIILFTGGFENVDTDIEKNMIIENRIKQKALVVAVATHKYDRHEINRITSYNKNTIMDYRESYDIYADNFTLLYSSFANRLYPFVLKTSVCEAGPFSAWTSWYTFSGFSSDLPDVLRFRICLPGIESCIGHFYEYQSIESIGITSPDKCSNINFIFVFVLDSSSIVDDQGWADEKKLVLNFLKRFLFGVNLNVDVAVVNFGTTSRIEADCGIYKNLSSFTIFMNNLPRINGGTAIHEGLTNAEIALQRCLKLNSSPFIILLTGGFENVDTDIDKNIIIEDSIKSKAIVVAGATHKYNKDEIDRITTYDYRNNYTLHEPRNITYAIFADNFTYLYSRFANRLYCLLLVYEFRKCEDDIFAESCSPESVGDINFNGVYYFPNTAVNGISLLRCVYNTSIMIQRRCIFNSITGASEWDLFDSSVCPAKSQTTQQLSDLNKVIITASTVESTAFNLSKIVQVGSLSTYDISLISNIITSLINANNSSFEVTNHIISTVDTVLSNPVLSVEANKQYNVSSNFMYQLDLLGNQQTGNITISRKNLALASYSIETNQNPVFIYSTLNQNNLTVKILSENKTSVLQNIKAYIILPQELFIGQNKTQVYSYVFLEKSVLFAGPSNKINSIILSATINGQNVKNSPYPISMMFLRENNDSGNRTCQFYTQDQVWSTNGCNTSSNSSEKVMCQCDHLTNFALIIDTDQTGNNPLSLQIITWIGCGISIAGLFITILSYLIFPKILLYLSSKILLNLCVSLMITLIIFLSLVQKTEPRLLCQIVASLLQFFILSTFFWMAVEGINLYISLVKVFRGSYSSGLFMLKSCAFAWGVPLIATVVTAAINRDNLGPLTEKDQKICVVRGLSFYFGVLLPLCIVVVVNIIFIFLVLKGVGANYNFGANSSASNINDIKKKARIALGCSLLLGTTWIFAILAVGDLRDVFQWLFCIFNSLQGFFIFIFYVVQNKDVRNQWHLLLKKKIAAKDVVTLSDITNQNRTR